MRLSRPFVICTGLLVAGVMTISSRGFATDGDGGNDCDRQTRDFGDAPECISAYGPPGTLPIGQFPTCITSCGRGTQELAPGCPPRSTAPGPTGYVEHLQLPTTPGNFWLGCYPDPATGRPFMGIDSETDGKTSNPFVAGGLSACSAIPLDCSEAAFGTTFGQDECYLDGSDAGITEPVTFLRCELNQQLRIAATYCGPQPSINVYLNILIDWNHDGDWNDIDICGPGFCAYEWPWKNTLVSLRQGCNFMGFNMDAGSKPGPSWLRVSLTQDPVSDDYPWAGSERTGAFHGGETEDYPVVVEQEVPTKSSTWGHMKGHYR